MMTPNPPREPIALIGRSLRFPGATSPAELFNLLSKPRDLLTEFPPVRLNIDGYYHPDGEQNGTTNVRKSYFIEQDHRVFDAAFFNISPVEAEAMDPQQRILLELVYEALESAGFTIDELQGSRTSVYVGSMSADYATIQHNDGDTIPKYGLTGTANSVLSNRISYYFDWKGPSMTVDTACSSSLVAVHQAIQSLRSGESDLAVVAGANLILNPQPFIAETQVRMLSPTSRCRMWDSQADGYARGEGFAVLVLKRLQDATIDNDQIFSVIRETAINQDGRTAGITQPSPVSQVAVIREAYERTGLDCRLKTDRCQYFEAHGTGTPTGDPIEAEAVRTAFFQPSGGGASDGDERDDFLYVGSIKSVVGHLEGCAGLAGLLKASLAVEYGLIFPNMHFETLSPAVAPFYHNIQVPTVAHPWPDIEPGAARRASVNSFGFGGANAHAVIESYTKTSENYMYRQNGMESSPDNEPSDIVSTGGLFVFSANSKSSLVAIVQSFIEFLISNRVTNLNHLAWTLQTRRTVLPVRAAFSNTTQKGLLESLEAYVKNATITSDDSGAYLRRSVVDSRPGILGVFTGQGAQWPQMGRQLLLTSKVFEKAIDSLQKSLDLLPDTPSWTLKDELMAEPVSSRVLDATIGQPLCTAVQIALIDLLKCAGICFSAVVGHSSGEIAAAYAAGYLSAFDAIRVAYYRGVHVRTAGGPKGQAGAMMAVNMSFNEGLEFCQSIQFSGRLVVAASNASNSITLSGDADAIQEARSLLEGSPSAKILYVDKAYHSHHMDPASEPYIRSLRKCRIQRSPGRHDCLWISSVTADPVTALTELSDRYWADNMVQPVLFSQAIQRAVRDAGSFDFIVEVGPHSTLRVPAIQSAGEAGCSELSYCSLLKRGAHDVEAFSGGIGSMWTALGSRARIDFDGYRAAIKNVNSSPQTMVSQTLPSYPWDHHQTYWTESRISRNVRFRGETIHQLLGRRRPDDSAQEMRWRKILYLEELPWLRGHCFQGQVIFPAAGYVSMALEVAKILVQDRTGPDLNIEIRNLTFSRALILNDDSTGTEIFFNVRCLEQNDDMLSAEFTCSSCSSKADAELQINAAGQIHVTLGELSTHFWPLEDSITRSMLDINVDRFYETLSELGLDYAGPFRCLKKIQRTTRMVTASASWSASDTVTSLIVHPAVLDVGFQAAFASSGSVTTLHAPYLPTHIDRTWIKASTTQIQSDADIDIKINAHTIDISPPSLNNRPMIRADLDIFCGDRWTLQVEGLSVTPISSSSPSNDRRLFWKTSWEKDISSGVAVPTVKLQNPLDDTDMPELVERLSHMYLRQLYAQYTKERVSTLKWYHQRLFEYMESIFSLIDTGEHSIIKREWAKDTPEQIFALLASFPVTIDVEATVAVAECFPDVISGEKSMIEILTQNDMLTRIYSEGLVLARGYNHIADMARQICHRYPSAKIIEIGAGTGSTTAPVLDGLNDSFSSYAYTDISSGFFIQARERFQKFSAKMEFKALNIEIDPTRQGFSDHTYDIVVASSCLHATRCLKETLTNVRKLLRPGGYLLLLELTGASLRVTYLMCGLEGWWLGGEDGRKLHPGLSEAQWGDFLRETGFSGMDVVLRDSDIPSKHVYSAILSQATDDQVAIIREPIQYLSEITTIRQLVIVGGRTSLVDGIIQEICQLLQLWQDMIVKVQSLEAIENLGIISHSTVLCLTDMDETFFEPIAPNALKGIQLLFGKAKNALWVTSECRLGNSSGNMMIGIARVLMNETPHLNLQMLDIDGSKPNARLLVNALLRLQLRDTLDADVLWSTEPELALDNENLLIPRLVPNRILNNRLNSDWRCIQADVPSQSGNFEVKHENQSFYLRQISSLDKFQVLAGQVAVRVRLSLLQPIDITSEICAYLCLGSLVDTGKTVVTLALSNASIIQTRSNWVQECHGPIDEEEGFLRSIAENILARNILSGVPPKGALLLHQPDLFIASAVIRLAADLGVQVICSTTQSSSPRRKGGIYIHPQATKRQVKSLLPSEILKLVDFDAKPHENMRRNLIACLAPFSYAVDVTTLFRDQVLIKIGANADASIMHHIRTAISDIEIDCEAAGISNKIMAGKLNEAGSKTNKVCIIDWRQQDTFSVNIRPLDAQKLLHCNRTYFFAGMTGDLGQSICRWMIQNGARHIVLTSRHGVVPDPWLKDMQGVGANVRVLRLDIADREALSSVYSEIRQTMPPIAGVVNGAMVLSDAPFAEMTFESMTGVLKPKVDGSKNLDALFRKADLDFFIMLTSLSSIAGFPSQANYAAANMFMTGLAAKRRQEGLAASVVAIGLLTEVGYVSRAGNAMLDNLRSRFPCLPISEPELHQMFAETVLASRVESDHFEIITGLANITSAMTVDVHRPPWVDNPRFAHCHVGDILNEKMTSSATIIPVKQRLNIAVTAEEALRILQKELIERLTAMLQINPSSINEQTSLVDLGVDSLIAIEIRSWFVKELEVDLPVLKTLSGCTITELCNDAIGKLSLRDTQMPNGIHQTSVPITNGAPTFGSSTIADFTNGIELLKTSHGSSDVSSSCNDSTGSLPKIAPLHIESIPIVNGINGHIQTNGVDDQMTVNGINDHPLENGFTDHLRMNGAVSTNLNGIVHNRNARELKQLSTVETAPMSYAQARLWFLSHNLENHDSLNVVISYNIKGPLSAERFKNAFKAVISRHQIFRTYFFSDARTGEAMQGILEKSKVDLDQKMLYMTDETEIQQEIDRIQNHRFQQDRGKLFQATLFRRTDLWSTFVFGYNHIMMDGNSVFIFLQDLNEAYQKLSLNPALHEYIDFASDQRSLVEVRSLGKELRFWKNEFSSSPETLPLMEVSSSRTRSGSGAYRTHTVQATIPPNHTMRLKKMSKKLQATPFHFHLATVQWLLFKFLASTENICIGIADSNRQDSRFLHTMGIFLNLLPLRFRRPVQATFSDTLRNTSNKVLSALEHSKLPFEVMLEELDVERSMAYMPLFQVFVNYRIGAFQHNPLGDCEMQHRSVSDAMFPYDISITITEPTKESCIVSFTVRGDIYSEDACRLLMKAYIHMLGEICDNPDQTLEDSHLFSRADARLAIDLGRGAKRIYRLGPTLQHHIDAKHLEVPHAIAIKDGYGNILSYHHVFQQSLAIAGILSTAGISKGSYVAVLMYPNSFTATTILAILRLGAIYVPLDLENHPQRLEAITADCRPAAIICQANTIRFAKTLCSGSTTIVDLTFLPEGEYLPTGNCSQGNIPAFALYTSGSTGVPKGVLLSQTNLLQSVDGTFGIGRIGTKEVVLQQSSLSFDLSLYQITRAIVSGGTLIIAAQALRRNPQELSKLMAAEKVSLTIATPSEYSLLLSYGTQYLKQCTSWQFAAFAGESMSLSVAQLFRRMTLPNLTLLNWFGPTEAGVYSTGIMSSSNLQNLQEDAYSSIGQPIPNCSVYVVDGSLRPVPTGFPGELCISGPNVALGYVSDEILTKTKFSSMDFGDGIERIYRSGDKGRINSEGTITFLGRIDSDPQVKLRGFRIDLEDIKSTIIREASNVLTDAEVSVRGNPAFIVAFVVFLPDNVPTDPAQFLDALRYKLPLSGYMRPSVMIQVPRLPVTTNGKRDRAALDAIPLSVLESSESVPETPFSEMETQLRDMWIEVVSSAISISQIRRGTSFFHVGGSSILLMRLQSRISEVFDVKLSLQSLFQFSKLGQMAARIDATYWQTEQQNKPRFEDNEATLLTNPLATPAFTEGEIDWEAETTIPDGMVPWTEVEPRETTLLGKTIILTGSTEILGQKLLQQLIKDSNVAKVHCLAVPSANVLENNVKVETHVGSLSMPTLNLSPSVMEQLADEADLILHASVEGSFLNSYRSISTLSLTPVRCLARIASKRRIPIHFISSSRVILFSGASSLREISVAPFFPPQDGSEGLAAARWACERFLQNVANQLCVPVCIHRCCAFTSDEKPTFESDVLNAIWWYSRQLKATPILEMVDGYIDCMPLNALVDKLVGALDLSTQQHDGDIKIIHHTSGKRVQPQHLSRYFADKEASPLNEIELTQWIQQARDMGLSGFAASFLEAVRHREKAVFFPLLLNTADE